MTWLGRVRSGYGCATGGWEPRPQDLLTDPTWTAGRYGWYPPFITGPHTIATPLECMFAVGGGACCQNCAVGKTCVGRGPERARVEVGRSQPNDEIAAHEAATQQLKADINSHQPKVGDVTETANWAALDHRINGYLLRWGQFKTALANDWWWGDDDEQQFAALKDEYNHIRDDFLKYTSGQTQAPAVVVAPPKVEKEPGQQVLDTAKGLVWLAAVGVGAFFLLPPLIGRIARRAA